MNIPALLNSSLSSLLFPSLPADKSAADQEALASRSLQDDVVALSAAGQGLSGSEQGLAKKVPPGYQLVPVDQRPSPEQSADVILGFISGRLQSMAAEGADAGQLEQAYNQAVKGFQQGLEEAKDILQGLQMMPGDIAAGIDQTEQLVTEGLAQLKQQLLADQPVVSDKPVEAVNTTRKMVEAYREQSSYVSSSRYQSGADGVSGLRGAAAAYADSYRRNDTVELALRTQDGDIVTLSFNSAASAQSSSAATVGASGGALAYQQSSSFSASFSMSVRGDLDAGEMDALNSLLEDVSALSDEFFNGDFDKAFAMAMDFEMDASEFSAMSLDISRSTSASMVQAYAGVSGQPEVPGNDLNELVDQLLAMLDKAGNFAEPRLLLTDLIANEMAQQLL